MGIWSKIFQIYRKMKNLLGTVFITGAKLLCGGLIPSQTFLESQYWFFSPLEWVVTLWWHTRVALSRKGSAFWEVHCGSSHSHPIRCDWHYSRWQLTQESAAEQKKYSFFPEDFWSKLLLSPRFLFLSGNRQEEAKHMKRFPGVEKTHIIVTWEQ